MLLLNYKFIYKPLVPDRSPYEAEISIANLKKYASPGSDKIPAEIIQTGGETSLSSTNRLIPVVFRIRKNCLVRGRSLLLYQFTKRGKVTVS
jgi:hypothetical protein